MFALCAALVALNGREQLHLRITFVSQLIVSLSTGAGIAQWLERRTRD